MKTKLFSATLSVIIQINLPLYAQTISNVETLALSPNSYWDGSTVPYQSSFTTGNAIFPNKNNGYWSEGWAYSNMKDSATAGYTNMYSAAPAIGYNGSANYLIGQNAAIINLNNAAIGKIVSGFYITNGTYAAISMRDGDGFARKFGDTTGTNAAIPQGDYPDWFKLTVHKYFGGILTNDSVEVYLADYRFSDNTQDYILKTWQWVDISSLGNVDSLKFILSSSDMGDFGINTPPFFCMDNFTTADSALGISENNNNLSIALFPNPANSNITVNMENLSTQGASIEIIDANGALVYSSIIYKSPAEISVDMLPTGYYHLKVKGKNFEKNKTFIKN